VKKFLVKRAVTQTAMVEANSPEEAVQVTMSWSFWQRIKERSSIEVKEAINESATS